MTGTAESLHAATENATKHSGSSALGLTIWPSLNRPHQTTQTNPATTPSFNSRTGMLTMQQQKCAFLSAEDSKQRVTKSESNQLRNSVLCMSRPKNPYFDPALQQQGLRYFSETSSSSSGFSSISTPSSSPSPISSKNASPKLQNTSFSSSKSSEKKVDLSKPPSPQNTQLTSKTQQTKIQQKACFPPSPPKLPQNKTKAAVDDDLCLIENVRLLEQLEFEDLDRRERQKQSSWGKPNRTNKIVYQPKVDDPFLPMLLSPSLLVSNKTNSSAPSSFASSLQHGNSSTAAEDQLDEILKRLNEVKKILHGQSVQAKTLPKSNTAPRKNKTSLDCAATCTVCLEPIIESVIRAFGEIYHPKCFSCASCDTCLDGIPFTIDEHASNKLQKIPLCMQCYELHFVSDCHRCRRPINPINGSGQIIRIIADDKEFHLDCYKCEGCDVRLDKEKNYIVEDRLLCATCQFQWNRSGGLTQQISDL